MPQEVIADLDILVQALAAAASRAALDAGCPGAGAGQVYTDTVGAPQFRRPGLALPCPHRRLCCQGARRTAMHATMQCCGVLWS